MSVTAMDPVGARGSLTFLRGRREFGWYPLSRRRVFPWVKPLVTILLATLFLPGVTTSTAAEARSPNLAALDRFGVRQLFPTTTGGPEWHANWDNGKAREFGGTREFTGDPEFDTNHGDGAYKVDGVGQIRITGKGPRMYVHDPANGRSWGNVEITVYGRRVADTGVSYAGIMAYARTNHGTTGGDEKQNLCDCRGYGGMFTYDGRIQFEKETAHHLNSGYAQVGRIKYWPAGMPKNQWLGYKFVVRDCDAGKNVKLELYLDLTDGADGGTWIKVNEFTDTGNNFGNGSAPCREDVDSALALTTANPRAGSETGQPNLTVYFRSDGVLDDGLWLKKASIREIRALP